MRRKTLQWGDVKVTVEAPEGFRLDVDVQVFTKTEEDFNAATEAFGGLGSFIAVDTTSSWLRLKPVPGGDDNLGGRGTVFVAPAVLGGIPAANPGMVKLAAQQREETVDESDAERAAA